MIPDSTVPATCRPEADEHRGTRQPRIPLRDVVSHQEDEMKYVVAMTFRNSGSAAENEAASKRLLDLYSKWSPPEGSTFHQFVGRLDGGGTFAVVETEKPSDLAVTTAQFGPFIDYQIYPVQDIADTVRAAQEGLAFREGVS
ncbi:DUF3303 domain-containing protein [Mycobacterium sp. pV006]|uniref:DUF3303 domain-containing protein n=1 Tax=Mycobacterium sp. pV006 TaxID=3238983 RepID=UPI00351B3599